MKKTKIILIGLFLVFGIIINGCKKETEPPVPCHNSVITHIIYEDVKEDEQYMIIKYSYVNDSLKKSYSFTDDIDNLESKFYKDLVFIGHQEDSIYFKSHYQNSDFFDIIVYYTKDMTLEHSFCELLIPRSELNYYKFNFYKIIKK